MSAPLCPVGWVYANTHAGSDHSFTSKVNDATTGERETLRNEQPSLRVTAALAFDATNYSAQLHASVAPSTPAWAVWLCGLPRYVGCHAVIRTPHGLSHTTWAVTHHMGCHTRHGLHSCLRSFTPMHRCPEIPYLPLISCIYKSPLLQTFHALKMAAITTETSYPP